LGPPPLEEPQQIPELPPPPIRLVTQGGGDGATGTASGTGTAGGAAGVSVQTLDQMPSGTVVVTQPGEGKPKEGETQTKPDGQSQPQQRQQPQQPKKKKSFWRKIIPFL
jgi:hypothetical protein